MLEAHATGFPDTYRALLPHLLTPAVWQPRGSVPPLVRLIKAYVSKDAKAMEANGQIRTVLAITQQKLIPSKINDSYGFDLLKVVFTALPRADMVKYSKDILTSLFIRLQGSKTEKFVDGLLLFFCYLMAIKSEDVDADVVVVNVESIQPGYDYFIGFNLLLIVWI
jgi:exportin-2 (importin alpha re-exporter)